MSQRLQAFLKGGVGGSENGIFSYGVAQANVPSAEPVHMVPALLAPLGAHEQQLPILGLEEALGPEDVRVGIRCRVMVN